LSSSPVATGMRKGSYAIYTVYITIHINITIHTNREIDCTGIRKGSFAIYMYI